VAAGACTPPLRNYSDYRTTYYNNPTYASFPVIFVDWNQSSAYCAWMGKRLPTEAEWEKAARGPTPRAWPWGDASPTCALANIWPDPNVNAMCVGDTSTVGRYPAGASPYGALDMAGNVMEWVSDWFDPGYYSVSPVSNPTGPTSGAEKVTRGGSWGNWIYDRTHVRDSWTPAFRAGIQGFRCAKPVGLSMYLPVIRR
jgi:formylglycine-generating enzyme required for sulfatase activity